jgi:hypothetical protein
MTEEKKPSFVVNGQEYEVPTDLTLGEMCDAERYFGVEFGTDGNSSNVRMAAALLWVAVKRQNDTVTIDDIRALPPEVFKTAGEDDASPPPPPEEKPNGSSGTSGGDSLDGGGDPARIPAAIGRPS